MPGSGARWVLAPWTGEHRMDGSARDPWTELHGRDWRRPAGPVSTGHRYLLILGSLGRVNTAWHWRHSYGLTRVVWTDSAVLGLLPGREVRGSYRGLRLR
jgi:hypothetical protein